MDFFRQQERARRRTAILLLYFVLAVVFVVLVFNLMFFAAGAFFIPGDSFGFKLQYWLEHIYWEHPTAAVVLIMFYGASWRHVQLIDGGKAVAQLVGATEVDMQSREDCIKKYIHVVEEISIASGVPVPTLYVLSRDKSINAFVAGFVPTESVMVVTQGTLDELSRDELQGVVAHEFSHILNGDMRLHMRLVVMLAGVFAVLRLGQFFMQPTRDGEYDGRRMFSLLWMFGPVLYVIGYAGSLAGHLIKAAVSRQREYLADASAVQFTRQPQGLAGALYKIREQNDTFLRNYHIEDMSHLWFSHTLETHLESWLSSHPPLEQRIAAIDASYLHVQRGKEIVAQQTESASAELSLISQPVSSMVGELRPDAMQSAASMYNAIEFYMLDAAHSPLDAQAVVLGLLLLRTGESAMRTQENNELMQRALHLREHYAKVDRRQRLPLLDLALPALKKMKPVQKQDFLRSLQARVSAAAGFDLFASVLLCIVGQHLRADAGRDIKIKFHSLKPLLVDIQVVLSLLAKAGGRAGEAEVLYQRNMAVFQAKSGLPMLEQAVPYERLAEALDNLRHTSLSNRKLFIDVCEDMVRHDGIILAEEYELMRAIAECLDCPMPLLPVA